MSVPVVQGNGKAPNRGSLPELEASFPDRTKLPGQIKKIRGKIPQILSFLQRMEERIGTAAQKKGIPPEAFHIMYQQKAFHHLPVSAARWNTASADFLETAMNQQGRNLTAYWNIQKRASSLVENLNSRIRVYMNLKRIVPEKYFILLKVYFNTKKYHRSRIPERIGKSPLEHMTGKEYPEFLEVLGY